MRSLQELLKFEFKKMSNLKNQHMDERSPRILWLKRWMKTIKLWFEMILGTMSSTTLQLLTCQLLIMMDLMRQNIRFLMKTKAQTNRKVQSSILKIQVRQDLCLTSTNGLSMQTLKRNRNLKRTLLKTLLSELERMNTFQMNSSNIKTLNFDQEKSRRFESLCENE